MQTQMKLISRSAVKPRRLDHTIRENGRNNLYFASTEATTASNCMQPEPSHADALPPKSEFSCVLRARLLLQVGHKCPTHGPPMSASRTLSYSF